MEAPKIFKRPERVAKDLQAAVLKELQDSPAPEEGEQAEARRFETSENGPGFTFVDEANDIEYCVDVVDRESERVWQLAAWLSPPSSEFPATGMSHYLVVGSKNEARARLAAVVGGTKFVVRKDELNESRGAKRTGYSNNVAQRRNRVAQKQG